MNVRVGAIGRLFAPGYGSCYRCKTPWRFVRPHYTPHRWWPTADDPTGEQTRACFPLCEKCWAELATPERRLPYYWELWKHWREGWDDTVTPDERTPWTSIKNAVFIEDANTPWNTPWNTP